MCQTHSTECMLGFAPPLYMIDELRSLISKELPSPDCLGLHLREKKQTLGPPWNEFDTPAQECLPMLHSLISLILLRHITLSYLGNQSFIHREIGEAARVSSIQPPLCLIELGTNCSTAALEKWLRTSDHFVV